MLFLFSSFLYAKKPEKMVKRNYKITYKSIKEWSYRRYPANKRAQKAELSEQSMAFIKIADAMENQPDEKLKRTIKVALLRWGWLKGDPVLDSSHQVDYYMVWMELRQKLPDIFEPDHQGQG